MFWPPFFDGFLRLFFCWVVSWNATIFDLSALICILAFSLHVWHTRIISCSSCAFVDIRHKSFTYRIPPIHTLLPSCVIVAWGNLRWSSCIQSATTMPNKVGLSLLPSGSPWRISTSELWRILGCRTRILTILNLSRRACYIFPTIFRSCMVDSSPSLNTDGIAVAKSKNATYVG